MRDTLVFAAGLGFGAFAFYVLGAGDAGRVQAGPATLSAGEQIAQAARESRELPEAKRVDSSAERVAPVSDRTEVAVEDFTPPEGLLEMLPAKPPTEAELLQRYGKLSLPELIGAHKGVSSVLHSEATAFLEQKLERGLYTTQILPYGTLIDNPGKFPDGAPRSVLTRWHTLPNGEAEVWTAEIHPKEQPLLVARHAEVDWLSARIYSKKQELKKQEQ